MARHFLTVTRTGEKDTNLGYEYLVTFTEEGSGLFGGQNVTELAVVFAKNINQAIDLTHAAFDGFSRLKGYRKPKRSNWDYGNARASVMVYRKPSPSRGKVKGKRRSGDSDFWDLVTGLFD